MRHVLSFVLLLAIASSVFAGTGKFTILNTDPPGVGFNDPTPATPIGNNPGTTLGAQRINVFNAAAESWQKFLDTNVDIVASASFTNIGGCTATSGVLGQAAPMKWLRDFPNAPLPDTWYPVGLANKMAGRDLDADADIFVQFNAGVDSQTCLGTSDWYYGFDGNHGDDIDLYVVVMHELGHGLGIAGATGAPNFLLNRPAITDVHKLDLSAGLRWDQMSLAQRQVSSTNTGNLVWDGALTRGAATKYLGPATELRVSSPQPVARVYQSGLASFGADTTKITVSGELVAVVDGAAPAGDGCSALTNGAALAGKIALVDRGLCPFVDKALNAQAAGAKALIVVDNVPTNCAPIAMGGSDANITIPVISILTSDGNALKAQLSAGTPVVATFGVDSTRLAGASVEGYVRLYAPCTFEAGSSVHHFDTSASPNLLMEPFINDGLPHDPDLSLHQLLDIGWTSRQGRRFLKK